MRARAQAQRTEWRAGSRPVARVYQDETECGKVGRRLRAPGSARGGTVSRPVQSGGAESTSVSDAVERGGAPGAALGRSAYVELLVCEHEGQ